MRDQGRTEAALYIVPRASTGFAQAAHKSEHLERWFGHCSTAPKPKLSSANPGATAAYGACAVSTRFLTCARATPAS